MKYRSTHFTHVCLLPADPPEKLQLICPTCPLLLPVDSQQAVKAAAISLAFFKRQSTLSAGLGVKRITRAAAQARLRRQLLTLIEIWEKSLRQVDLIWRQASTCFRGKLWESCKELILFSYLTVWPCLCYGEKTKQKKSNRRLEANALLNRIVLTKSKLQHPSYPCLCVSWEICPFLVMLLFYFEVHPVKASFVEYTVQECPEGLTERGTCQRLTIESDTEVADRPRSGF